MHFKQSGRTVGVTYGFSVAAKRRYRVLSSRLNAEYQTGIVFYDQGYIHHLNGHTSRMLYPRQYGRVQPSFSEQQFVRIYLIHGKKQRYSGPALCADPGRLLG